MENYFWLLYIFDDPAKKQDRHEELVNSFKRDYCKLQLLHTEKNSLRV